MSMRRANGDGSIIFLKKNLRKPYMVRICTGEKTANGYHKRVPLDYFATRKEAEAFLAKYTHRPILKYNLSLGEIYKEWEEKRQRKVDEQKLSKAALDCNHAAWRWLSEIENEKGRLITTERMQEILDRMPAAGASRSAIEKVKSLASMLFEYMQQYDVVDRNYAAWLEIPRVEQISRDRWSEIELLKIEKAANGTLKEGVPPIEWADCILMMCYSGFRIDEFLQIKKFGAEVSNDGIILGVYGGNKTAAGKDRYSPIHPKVEPYWRKWYNSHSSEYFFPKSASMLSRKKGTEYFNKDWWRENCYYKAIDEINAQGGVIRRLVPHCCRHTFATKALAAGIEPEKIAILMGHTEYSHTRRYTHGDIADLNACISMIKA